MENKTFIVPEQQVVLKEKKSQIVSASAGSGKTTVMIAKVLNLLLEKECHVDELLVLTYTKSAATEMKKRLVEKIKDNLKEKEYLQEELEMVQSADICTFDSFCQKLVKKYFYILNIDPSFKVLDAGDQIFLQNNALDNALDELKQTSPEDYENLLANFSPARNENNIKTLVLEIYNYLTSVFDENEFWELSKKLYDDKLKIAENELNNFYTQKFKAIKSEVGNLLQQAVSLEFVTYSEFLNAFSSLLDAYILEKDFCNMVELASQVSLKPLYAQKDDEIGFKNKIAEQKSIFGKICDDLKKEYIDTQNIKNSYKNCQILLKNLQKLVKIFVLKYLEQKNAINTFDFNDIERMSIILLENPQINAEIKNSYKNIFVDEFQDANKVQEKIIFLLDNNNLFFVGDTKQSIYAFRQSEPDIFLSIEQKFKVSDTASANTLNSNFRTNKNILDFVNKIFSLVMTKQSCGIDYKNDAMFVPMANYEDVNGETCVSLDIILNEQNEQEKLEITKPYSVKENATQSEKLTAYDYESAYIAQKITELVGQDIYDNKLQKTKKINFNDITILLAKRGSFLNTLLKHLKSVGIPYIVNVNNSLEECYDNQVLFNMLKLVLNIQDDYALYSVLSSELFCFDNYELGKIKQENITEKYFYNCLKLYSTKNDNLAIKINEFYKTLENFAFDVKYKGIYFALNKIIKDTQYLLKIGNEDGYLERRLNIKAYINSFASSKFDSCLSEYILYRDTALRQEKAVADKSFNQSVEITTMHSSKGLEYPVVILPFLSQDYTKSPTHSEIKINKHLGIGVKNYNSDERSVSNGIFFNACKLKNKQTEISEKIRLLYVATTRAKNKLIMIGSAGKEYKKITDVFAVNNFLSLVVGSLSQDVIDRVNQKQEFSDILFGNDKLKINLLNVNIEENLSTNNIIPKISEQEDIDYIADFLNNKVSLKASDIALKNSVSEFAFDDDANHTFAPSTFKISEHLSAQASDVGTLYHKLLQIVDFSQINTIDDLTTFITCNFTNDEIDVFNKIGINNIFNVICNIKGLLSSANCDKNCLILKEQKFVMRIKHNEVVPNGEDCNILVQGVVDLMAVGKDEVLLIDYKYTSKDDEQIRQVYNKQIYLYELALKKRFKDKTIKKVIVNIKKNTLINM